MTADADLRRSVTNPRDTDLSGTGADRAAQGPRGIVYVDGSWFAPEEARISVFDHGLLYGDGVFEGIRFYNGRVFKLDRHVDRLFRSAELIDLVPPFDRAEVRARILEACARSNLRDGYLRPVITRGKGDLGLDPRKTTHPTLIIICSTIRPHGPDAKDGIRAIIPGLRKVSPRSLNPNAKSLNYLNSVLAKEQASRNHADEAILLDLDGNVAEATGENVFVVRSGSLYTPPTGTCLEGITRETILELAAGRIPCVVRDISLEFLMGAEEVFLTGTAAEVLPVLAVDQRPIGSGRPGPVTLDLQRRYFDLVRASGEPIAYRKGAGT
jgi:branched-chain amino acid aminotransferase